MRIVALTWALAATILLTGPAPAQDIGVRATVESGSIGGPLGRSGVAPGSTSAAGSTAAGLQRELTGAGVVSTPDAARFFDPRGAEILLADPTTLIGLPLVTNDAAIVGKYRVWR